MSLEKTSHKVLCRFLSLTFRGQTYPLRVKEIDLRNGSQTYSVEIQFDHSDTVVIDASNLAEGLREAETILPIAFAARKIPSH